MKGTYWYAVDYAGTGHLFTYKPERDAGIWNGEEALQVSQGALREVFPKITWQDSPVVVTLEVLPCEETFRLRLSKNCGYILRKYLRFPRKEKTNLYHHNPTYIIRSFYPCRTQSSKKARCICPIPNRLRSQHQFKWHRTSL